MFTLAATGLALAFLIGVILLAWPLGPVGEWILDLPDRKNPGRE